MLSPQPTSERRTNREIFFAYYARLLEWSLQLTRNDRSEAEDLVHDLYIQFTSIQLTLEDVDQIDPYLFAMLRNLYFAKLRRSGRSPIVDLSIVEYDSVERGLAAVDRRGLFWARADLKQVCEYACQRRNTSRSASILILRFFFGYYPSEVMQVAQATRALVDKYLQVSRKEARLYLERPGSIRCIVPNGAAPVIGSSMTDDSQTLFLELRRAIFSTCEGSCFGQRALEERYGTSPARGFSIQELAHLVSCRVCLDQANAILGLPLLEERSPVDTLGRNNPPGSGASGDDAGSGGSENSSGKNGKSPKRLRKMEKKAREVFEHRPQSLQVAVDGDIRTSQTVTAEISELQLKLNRTETPTFIEVLSEQDICMAYLQVANPALRDGLDQKAVITLSDGRSLDLTLSFASELPTVHVVYRDPVMSEDAETAHPPVLWPLTMGKSPFWEATEPKRKPTIVAQLAKAWLWFWEKFFDGPLGYAAILASFALIAVWLLMPRNQTPSSAVLLRQAAEAENSVPPGEAVHRQIEVSEISEAGTPLKTQRVDLWSGAAQIARRLYDDHGKLQVEELSTPENGSDIYGKNQVAHSAPARLANASISDVWRLTPNASEMQAVAEELPDQYVTAEPDHYVVDARSPQPARAGLVEAKLVLRKADLHATEEMLAFREFGRVRRFRLVEAIYERVPMREIKPGVFAPDSEFAPAGGESHANPSSSGLSSLRQVTPELAVHVLYQLSQIGADLGGQTQITRLPHGGLSVTGTLDSAEQKSELLRALADTKSASGVQVNVRVGGAPSKPSRRGAGRAHLEMIEPGADVVPADTQLRKMFAAKGVASSQMDDAVRDFCRQTTRLSLNARMQAWALSSALKLLTPQEVRELSPEGRQEWLTIVTRHATALRASLEDLRIQLAPLRDVPSGPVIAAPEIGSVEDVAESSTQILALVNAQDNAIRSALTLSPLAQPEPTQSFESPQFWGSMDRLLTFSVSVQETSQTLEAVARSPKAR